MLDTHTFQGFFVMKISTKNSQVTPACGSQTQPHSIQKCKLVLLHSEDLWFSAIPECYGKILDHHKVHWPYHQVYSSQPLLKAQHAPTLKGEQKTRPAQQNTLPLVHWAGFQGLRICISCHFRGYTGPAILHQKHALKEFQGQMWRRKKSKRAVFISVWKGGHALNLSWLRHMLLPSRENNSKTENRIRKKNVEVVHSV